MKKFLAIATLSIMFTSCMNNGPFDLEEVQYPSNEHLRGLSVVDEQTVWASGTHGTVLRSIDGGETWDINRIPGAEEIDFRDIEAFDANTAIVMSAGNPGRIYKTIDGGKFWRAYYDNDKPGIFMDGMAFDGEKGMIYGDPLNGMLLALRTYDGESYTRATSLKMIPQRGEAGFAASGTGIDVIGEKVWFGTGGGAKSRVFRSDDFGYTWTRSETPILSGEGAGIFSLSFLNDTLGLAVGGNYVDSTRNDSNAAITYDGGVHWSLLPAGALNGYRSCVTNTTTKDGDVYFVACGRTGAEYSEDGVQWLPLTTDGFYAVDFAGNYGWMVGKSGKMMKVEL